MGLPLRFPCLLIGSAAALLLVAPGLSAQQDDHAQKRVLVLYSLRQESPAFAIQEGVYRRRLDEGLAGQVDYYSEFMDVYRFEGRDYETALAEFLLRKYRGRHFDLVISNGPTALAFAARIRPQLFPDAPIVFNGVRSRTVANSAGFHYPFAMKGSIDFALELRPATKQVFVVLGTSEADQYYEDVFREQLSAPPPGIELIYLRGLPLGQLKETLGKLPADSAIFLVSLNQDGSGKRFVTAEIAEQLAAAANAPMFSWNANFRGVFGGDMLSTELLTGKTVALALRVLRGENPDGIPVDSVDASVRQLDWRQLTRWSMSESHVPAGVSLLFRQRGVVERYRPYIVGTIALITVQTGLIAGLLVQRHRRRRAEDSLRESETALRRGNEQIRDLAGRLITAQEAERARIARDLHDDFSQQLAGFSIALSGAKRRPGIRDDLELQQTLASLQRSTIELAEGVRHLSHELHPSVLQHAGLVDALRAHCSEVAQQHDLSVDLDVAPDVGAVDEGTSLCLYRITQEALRNIVKHAHARHVDVRLRRNNGSVDLSIADDGQGFDVSTVRAVRSGLGLRSIEERVRLARGRIDIETAPGLGTKLSVRLQTQDQPAVWV